MQSLNRTGGQVRLVLRPQPLTQEEAASSAVCTAQQRRVRQRTQRDLSDPRRGVDSPSNSDQEADDQGAGTQISEDHHVNDDDNPLSLHWRPPQRTPYEEVLRRKEERWDQAQPAIKQAAVSKAVYIAAYKRQQHASSQEQLELAIAHAASRACPDCTELSFISWRIVECWTAADFHLLQLPLLACGCGRVHGELPATYFGCFGSAPEQPKVMYEADLLRAFRHAFHNGTSASKFCETQSRLQADRESERGVERSGAVLDDSALMEAYRHWNPAQIRSPDSVGTVEFSPGRFGDCGACAKVPPFADQGMTAVRQRAEGLLGCAQLKLDGIIMRAEANLKDAASTSSAPESPAGHVDSNADAFGHAQDGAGDVPIEGDDHLGGLSNDLSASAGLFAEVPPATSEAAQAAPHMEEAGTMDGTTPIALPDAAAEVQSTTGVKMNPAEVPNKRPFGITADGCQKVNRYTNCGRTLGKVAQPHGGSYLGSCHDAVDDILQSLGRPTVQPATVQPEVSCGASLACARPYAAKTGGVTDIKCLITCTCLHTVPGKGCFMGVKTNEQFAFYDLLLASFLPDRLVQFADILDQHCRDGSTASFASKDRRLEAFYLDLNCQYSLHLRNLVGPEILEELRCHVGWLHSKAGHGLDCQLKFSAMFADGLGRAIGENAEQLHAFFKPLAKSLRYMALPNWHDFLDDAIGEFALRKREGFTAHFVKHVADVTKRGVELMGEVDAIKAKASSIGIVLDEDAAVNVDRPAAAFDDHMEYARLTMERDFLESFSGPSGAYLAAVNGAVGQELIAKLQSADSREKVLQRLATLQARLGIDSAWTLESADFKVHFQRLCIAQIAHLQAQIDRELSLLQLHRVERTDEGAASHASRLVTKRINAGRKRVRNMMLNWEFWHKRQIPEQPLPEYFIDDVFRGSPPWDGLSGAGQAGREELQLRLYRANAEARRCEEEMCFLPGEAANSLNLYRYQITTLCCAIESRLASADALAVGEIFYLVGFLRQVMVLERKAQIAFAKLGMCFIS